MGAKRSASTRRSARPAVSDSRNRMVLGVWSLAALAVGGFLLAAALEGRPKFDGDRAYADLKTQVEFGPRVPNLASHDACRDYMVSTLKPLADSVERQDWTQKIRATDLKMTNVIARWNGKSSQNGVLLVAHWDTRPQADQERDPERKRQPIPGANDGASGVAVLLEAARMFKRSRPPVPVMILMVDGEDYGPGEEAMYLGAQYFADHLPADAPKRGILLDMIGDRDLQIPQEANSMIRAREVMNQVYETARKLGVDRHFPIRFGYAIDDDHIPLLEKGIKIIDLIDFEYGPQHRWWHTLEDTPDKCSPVSLKVVGDVVTEWTYSQK